jgi:hypothetical protein
MDSRPADGSKSVLSAKRWFKARNGTLTVVYLKWNRLWGGSLAASMAACLNHRLAAPRV